MEAEKKFSVRKILQIPMYDSNSTDFTKYVEVPIYNIALNKKNSCFPFSTIVDKDGNEQKVPKCRNYYMKNYCQACVQLKKDIRAVSRKRDLLRK